MKRTLLTLTIIMLLSAIVTAEQYTLGGKEANNYYTSSIDFPTSVEVVMNFSTNTEGAVVDVYPSPAICDEYTCYIGSQNQSFRFGAISGDISWTTHLDRQSYYGATDGVLDDANMYVLASGVGSLDTYALNEIWTTFGGISCTDTTGNYGGTPIVNGVRVTQSRNYDGAWFYTYTAREQTTCTATKTNAFLENVPQATALTSNGYIRPASSETHIYAPFDRAGSPTNIFEILIENTSIYVNITHDDTEVGDNFVRRQPVVTNGYLILPSKTNSHPIAVFNIPGGAPLCNVTVPAGDEINGFYTIATNGNDKAYAFSSTKIFEFLIHNCTVTQSVDMDSDGALVSGIIYIDAPNGDFLSFVAGNDATTLYALDVTDLSTVWTINISDNVSGEDSQYSTPTYAEGIIIVPTKSNVVGVGTDYGLTGDACNDTEPCGYGYSCSDGFCVSSVCLWGECGDTMFCNEVEGLCSEFNLDIEGTPSLGSNLLNWTEVEYATWWNVTGSNYQLFRSAQLVEKTSIRTNTNYTDTGVLGGSTYSYLVVARDSMGRTLASSDVINVTASNCEHHDDCYDEDVTEYCHNLDAGGYTSCDSADFEVTGEGGQDELTIRGGCVYDGFGRVDVFVRHETEENYSLEKSFTCPVINFQTTYTPSTQGTNYIYVTQTYIDVITGQPGVPIQSNRLELSYSVPECDYDYTGDLDASCTNVTFCEWTYYPTSSFHTATCEDYDLELVLENESATNVYLSWTPSSGYDRLYIESDGVVRSSLSTDQNPHFNCPTCAYGYYNMSDVDYAEICVRVEKVYTSGVPAGVSGSDMECIERGGSWTTRCNNEVQDADEWDVDCGPACPLDDDCSITWCEDDLLTERYDINASGYDHLEDDVDCNYGFGGPCVSCDSNLSANNQIWDAGEYGIDCGGNSGRNCPYIYIETPLEDETKTFGQEFNFTLNINQNNYPWNLSAYYHITCTNAGSQTRNALGPIFERINASQDKISKNIILSPDMGDTEVINCDIKVALYTPSEAHNGTLKPVVTPDAIDYDVYNDRAKIHITRGAIPPTDETEVFLITPTSDFAVVPPNATRTLVWRYRFTDGTTVPEDNCRIAPDQTGIRVWDGNDYTSNPFRVPRQPDGTYEADILFPLSTPSVPFYIVCGGTYYEEASSDGLAFIISGEQTMEIIPTRLIPNSASRGKDYAIRVRISCDDWSRDDCEAGKVAGASCWTSGDFTLTLTEETPAHSYSGDRTVPTGKTQEKYKIYCDHDNYTAKTTSWFTYTISQGENASQGESCQSDTNCPAGLLCCVQTNGRECWSPNDCFCDIGHDDLCSTSGIAECIGGTGRCAIKKTCDDSDNCSSGEYCAGGYCAYQLPVGASCPLGGESCQSGVCEFGKCVVAPCVEDTDCEDGKICIDNSCEPPSTRLEVVNTNGFTPCNESGCYTQNQYSFVQYPASSNTYEVRTIPSSLVKYSVSTSDGQVKERTPFGTFADSTFHKGTITLSDYVDNDQEYTHVRLAFHDVKTGYEKPVDVFVVKDALEVNLTNCASNSEDCAGEYENYTYRIDANRDIICEWKEKRRESYSYINTTFASTVYFNHTDGNAFFKCHDKYGITTELDGRFDLVGILQGINVDFFGAVLIILVILLVVPAYLIWGKKGGGDSERRDRPRPQRPKFRDRPVVPRQRTEPAVRVPEKRREPKMGGMEVDTSFLDD